MHAIILDRNKQYLVKQGLLLQVDCLNIDIGEVLCFDKILLLDDGVTVVVGDPFISDKKVVSKVVSHIKGKKKVILKFKRRKNYVRKIGHRQRYTLLEIISFENK